MVRCRFRGVSEGVSPWSPGVETGSRGWCPCRRGARRRRRRSPNRPGRTRPRTRTVAVGSWPIFEAAGRHEHRHGRDVGGQAGEQYPSSTEPTRQPRRTDRAARDPRWSLDELRSRLISPTTASAEAGRCTAKSRCSTICAPSVVRPEVDRGTGAQGTTSFPTNEFAYTLYAQNRSSGAHPAADPPRRMRKEPPSTSSPGGQFVTMASAGRWRRG